jgi:hypothetical protein
VILNLLAAPRWVFILGMGEPLVSGAPELSRGSHSASSQMLSVVSDWVRAVPRR